MKALFLFALVSMLLPNQVWAEVTDMTKSSAKGDTFSTYPQGFLKEECNPTNDYLEAPLKEFGRLFGDDFIRLREDLPLTSDDKKFRPVTPQCIQRSQEKMALYAKTSTRKICVLCKCTSTASRPIEQKIAPACQSASYVAAMTNSLNAVATCFKIPARELFPLLSHESGFQVNANSGTGSRGVGQLSRDAIDAVNGTPRDASFTPIRNEIKGNPLMSCAAVNTVLKNPINSRRSHACERTDVPPNPLRGLVYAAGFYRINQAYISKNLSQLAIAHDLSKILDENDIEVLRKHLTQLAYNSGMSVMGYLRTYLEENSKGLRKEDFNMTATPLRGFSKYLLSHYRGDRNRRDEVATYLPKIKKDIQSVNNTVGGAKSCSDLY